MIALIGCGYWGKNIARNLYELNQLSLIADPTDEGKKNAVERAPGVTVQDSFNFDDFPEHINGVAIATPAATHYRLSKEALNAGLHVFCEKPIALKVKEAEELKALAIENNLALMVGHVLEYHPAFLKLRSMIGSGEIGELRYMYSNRLSLGKIRTEENILWSFAPHDIALLIRMAGSAPEAVSAIGSDFIQNGIYDVTLTHLRFPGGIRAHIHVSWLHPFKEHLFVAIGSEKMLTYDDVSKKLLLYDQKVTIEDGIPTPQKANPNQIEFWEAEPLKEECREFIQAIEKGKDPLTNGHSAVQVLKVLELAEESIKNKSTFQKAKK